MIELLAELSTHASQFSQLWITTHSQELVKAIENQTGCRSIRLEKVNGKTRRDRGGKRSGTVYASDD